MRNAATLSFASLLTKVCGYMNQVAPKAGGSARRAVTGDEFFNRFPSLHPFLLAELADATALLESPQGQVHPSLYPILALLSRLRPSVRKTKRRPFFNFFFIRPPLNNPNLTFSLHAVCNSASFAYFPELRRRRRLIFSFFGVRNVRDDLFIADLI